MTFVLKLFRFWVLLTFVGVSGYLAIYNQDPVQVSLPPWYWDFQVPLYAALMGAMILGATICVVFFGFEHVRSAFALKKLKKKARTAVQDSSTDLSHPPSSLPADTTDPRETF